MSIHWQSIYLFVVKFLWQIKLFHVDLCKAIVSGALFSFALLYLEWGCINRSPYDNMTKANN